MGSNRLVDSGFISWRAPRIVEDLFNPRMTTPYSFIELILRLLWLLCMLIIFCSQAMILKLLLLLKLTLLHSAFSIKDLGHLHYFLGFEVGYQADGIILSQNKFTKELLSSFGISSFKIVVIPLPLNTKPSAHTSEFFHDPSWYRCMVRKLNFLTNTRP